MDDAGKKIVEINNLANLLYTSYVARDFFAKIVPGFVAVILTIYLLDIPIATSDQLGAVPLIGWILGIGVLYAIGFTIQRIGESYPTTKHPIIRLYDKGWSSETYGETVEEFFRKAPSTRHHAQRERYVVIKELYGNLAVALMIILVEILGRTAWSSAKDGSVPLGLEIYAVAPALLICIFGLLAGNRKLCRSEQNWINKTIGNPNPAAEPVGTAGVKASTLTVEPSPPGGFVTDRNRTSGRTAVT